MLHDIHGLPVSTTSAQACQSFNRALSHYLTYRVDTPDHLARSIEADPEFCLAHCTKGYLVLLTFKQANIPSATEAARTARRLAAGAGSREQQHVAALEAWIEGDLDRMLGVWEQILLEHPTDILAFRLAHFNNFWLGRARDMQASVDRLHGKWSRELAAYGTLLACRSFAYEECGDYATAEASGRAAVEIDPADLWATHAVAHVMEMQGRHAEGIAWLDTLQPYWEGCNNLVHHLWWHRALFHLERREFDAVLKLYDRRFRNLASPLTQAQPDLYIDIQNAASMLFRLERLGIDPGERWSEIADHAEQRIGDCRSAFTLPHWMLALAATGRDRAARRLIEAMQEYGHGTGTLAPIVGEVAVPIAEAILAHRHGDHGRAADLMQSVHGETHRLGGSHAQRDLLAQIHLDAALKAGRIADVRRLLAQAAAQRTVPLTNRIGYADAAQGLEEE